MSGECIRELSVIITEEPGHTVTLKSTTPKNGVQLNGCRILKLPFQTENTENGDCITLSCLISNKIELQSITSLGLTLCDLSFVPTALCALKNLRRLNLSRNKLREIPSCLEQGLYLLQNLDLSFNFIENFETEPKCYNKLRSLRINNNMLNNIPEWILYARCFNLEEFVYSFNNLTCLDVSRYDTSCNYRLQKVEMCNCNILSEDIKFISKIRTLQHLNLSNDKSKKNLNSLCNGDELFENPCWIHTLQVLQLNSLNLTIVSNNIVNLVNLRVLELQDNNLMWLPDSITSLINLQELDVSRNCIAYLPSELKVLKGLKVLKVQYNQLCAVPDISSICNLQYIDLYENLLEDCDFDVNSIECIDLEMNYIDTTQLSVMWDYPKKKIDVERKSWPLSL